MMSTDPNVRWRRYIPKDRVVFKEEFDRVVQMHALRGCDARNINSNNSNNNSNVSNTYISNSNRN
jgi:energy-coupling factor transporter transmembrane protein EcfT